MTNDMRRIMTLCESAPWQEQLKIRYRVRVYDGTESHNVRVTAIDEEDAKKRALAFAENKYGTSWWRIDKINRIDA